MNKALALVWLAILIIGVIPSIANYYRVRPGAGPQVAVVFLLGVLIVGFWWWVRERTYDTLSFKRRKREWDEDES